MKHWRSLLAFLALCAAVQAFASWCTFQSVTTWYPAIAKPDWRPPNWLFGPVWTLLYIGMAVAAWRVWIKRNDRDIRPALVMFFIQLALNGFWSVLFFSWNAIGAAGIEIIILWMSIAVTGVLFWRIDRFAGGLMAPYWMWVTYATALNLSIWSLNS